MTPDELLPSRVRDRLLAALKEIENEIEREEDERFRKEGADPYSSGAEFLQEMRETVSQLIDAKTGWLEQGSRGALYDHHVPAWYLDYQRELAEILLTRRWLINFDRMISRLVGVPSLVLSKAAPRECRISLYEAALCHVNGLQRAAGVLCRISVETALLDSAGDQPFARSREALHDAIGWAQTSRLLTREGVRDARRVQQVGNAAAHGDAVAEPVVREALASARRVIQELYGGIPDEHSG